MAESASPKPSEATDQSPAKPEVIHFDKYADLILKAGQAQHEFHVDARSLARACNAWDTMLFGPFTESKSVNESNNWIVELPEDDPAALKLLLWIIHGNYKMVPATLPCLMLHNVTIVTDKYDLAAILRPWALKWCTSAMEESKGEYDLLVWITWELGSAPMFQKVVNNLVRSTSIDSEGFLVFTTGQRLADMKLVQSISIIDDISKSRLEAVTQLLEMLRTFIDQAIHPERKKAPSPICKNPHRDGRYYTNSEQSNATCHLVLLGAVFRACEEYKLFPVPMVSVVKESLDKLCSRIKECCSSLTALLMTTNHAACHSEPKQLSEQVDGLLEALKPPVTPVHLQHIQSQADKTGLINSVCSTAENKGNTTQK